MIFISLPKLSSKLGITKQGLAKLVDTRLKGAVSWRGKKRLVDLEHVLFKQYYQTKELTLKKNYSEFVEACKPDCLVIELPQDIEQKEIKKRNNNLDNATILTKHKIDELGNLTLREIIEQHGDLYNYSAVMQSYKATLEIQKLSNQVCKQRGELIDAEVLTKTCKGYLDALASALLTDFVNWSVQEVAALTDCSKQKQILLTDKFKSEMSRQLKNTQARTIQSIEKAQEI